MPKSRERRYMPGEQFSRHVFVATFELDNGAPVQRCRYCPQRRKKRHGGSGMGARRWVYLYDEGRVYSTPAPCVWRTKCSE